MSTSGLSFIRWPHSLSRNLKADDPRRAALEDIEQRLAAEPSHGDIPKDERVQVSAAERAAKSNLRRRLLHLSSFLTAVYFLSICLLIAAVSLAIVAAVSPSVAPLCFNVEGDVICPTTEAPVSLGRFDDSAYTSSSRMDCAVVETLGLLAGAVAAALALRNLRGTSIPYGLPVALAVLKLPVGALFAVLGVLVVRARLLIGFPDITTPSHSMGLLVRILRSIDLH